MAVTFHLRGALVVHSSLPDALTVSTAPHDACRSYLTEGLKSPGLSLLSGSVERRVQQSRRSLTDSRARSKLSSSLYGCLVVVRDFGRGALA